MGSTKIKSQQASTTTPTPTAEETELNKLQLEQQRAIQPYAIPLQQQAYTLGQLLLQGQGLPGYLAPLPQGATAYGLSPQPDISTAMGALSYQPDIPTSAGYLAPPGSIPTSMGALGEEATREIVAKSLRDIYPQFQAMGLPIESGVAQSIAGRTAGDIRRQVGERNLERQLGIEQYNREMQGLYGTANVERQLALEQFNRMQRGETAESNIARQLAIEEYNRQARQATGEYNINTAMATQYQNLNTLLNLLNLAVGGQAQVQQPVLATGATLGQRLAGLRTINQTGTGSQTTKYDFFTSPFTQALLSAGGTAAGGWMGR